MLVFEKDIPSFIHCSPFLQGMLSEGPFPEAGIDVPDGCLKQNMEVVTRTDLMDLYHTLRFWLLPDLLEDCPSFLKFAWSPSTMVCFLICSIQFLHEFPLAKDLVEIMIAKSEEQLSAATLSGRMPVVRYMVEELHFPVTDIAGVAAASRSDLQCLDYFRSQGMKFSHDVCFGACLSGTLPSIQYMIENQAEGVDYLSSACARRGNFETLKYAIEQVDHSSPYNISIAFEIAANQGHVELLTQMRAEWQDPVHGRYDSNMVFYGAQNGQLDVLKFAKQSGVAMAHFQNAVRAAAMAQDVRCLRFVHELGCMLTYEAMDSAARKGHLPVLRYLFKHDCPGREQACSQLARGGHFESLKYAHERGCPWDKATSHAAAEAGSLQCLKYARQHGCPWRSVTEAPPEDGRYTSEDTDITLSAARAPSAACLQYVVAQGVGLHPMCGGEAASSRSVETLRFLHARGFTWGTEDCAAAAGSGSVECLRFLHEIDTPWDARTCSGAAHYNLSCLQYAHEHGCPWDESTTRNAKYCTACYEYAVEHGCPEEEDAGEKSEYETNEEEGEVE